MLSDISMPQVRACCKTSSKEQCSEANPEAMQDWTEASTFKQSSITSRFTCLSRGADRQLLGVNNMDPNTTQRTKDFIFPSFTPKALVESN